MKSFLEWLFLENAYPQVNWIKENDTWVAKLHINNIGFEITFFQSVGGIWKVQFYQLENNFRTMDHVPVDTSTLINLFQVIDDGLLALFTEHPEIKVVSIHPEATSKERMAKIQNRTSNKTYDFDVHKFNAYQLLFSHSKLYAQGFKMQPKGEELLITRQEKGISH